ncbi:MAG: hypothetical protein QXD64_08935 [Thermoplasmata archaeon]
MVGRRSDEGMVIIKVHKRIFFFSAFLFILSPSFFGMLSSMECSCNDVVCNTNELTERGHIYIDGNKNFTKENGVVRGNGTRENPYTIENYRIVRKQQEEFEKIRVVNTSAYFIIRNCILGKPNDTLSHAKCGISLVNVSNAMIENISLSSEGPLYWEHTTGFVGIYKGKNITIKGCHFRWPIGYKLNSTYVVIGIGGNSENITIINNEVDGTAGNWICGVYFESAAASLKNILLRNNLFINCGLEIHGWSPSCTGWDIDTTNTVEGKPILYVWDRNNFVLYPPHDGCGQLIVTNCTNFTIMGFKFEKKSLSLLSCKNGKIINNNFTNVPFYGDTSCENTEYKWNWLNLSKLYGFYLGKGSAFLSNTIIYDENCSIVDYEGGNRIIGDKNYWSTFNAPDEDNDGIVDVPYVIVGNGRNQTLDLHPLSRFASHFDIYHAPPAEVVRSFPVNASFIATRNLTRIVLCYKFADENGWCEKLIDLDGNKTTFEFNTTLSLRKTGTLEYFFLVTDETRTTLSSPRYTAIIIISEQDDKVIPIYEIVAVLITIFVSGLALALRKKTIRKRRKLRAY